jgi:hypothetical protein
MYRMYITLCCNSIIKHVYVAQNKPATTEFTRSDCILDEDSKNTLLSDYYILGCLVKLNTVCNTMNL